jgi:catechol 2,3-dioxygenase-like lactoylglutathione lyase family enzyme
MEMKYLHTMVRVTDLEQSLHFYRDLLGLKETRRIENEKGRFTLIFLAPPGQEEGADRADLQLGPRDLYRRPQLRPPGL